MGEREITTGTSMFEKELRALINSHSKENGSNTPDHILAGFLNGCLAIFDASVNCRERWYDRPTADSGEGVVSFCDAKLGEVIDEDDPRHPPESTCGECGSV